MNKAFHFMGWRDAQAMRPATWQEHWTSAQRAAYDKGYSGE